MFKLKDFLFFYKKCPYQLTLINTGLIKPPQKFFFTSERDATDVVISVYQLGLIFVSVRGKHCFPSGAMFSPYKEKIMLNQLIDEEFTCFEEYPRDKYNSIFLSDYLKELVRNDISFKLVKTEDKYIVLLKDEKDELHLH